MPPAQEPLPVSSFWAEAGLHWPIRSQIFFTANNVYIAYDPYSGVYMKRQSRN